MGDSEELSLTDRALVTTVDEDLAYLTDEWEPCLDSAALRRLSPILRRLLIHGDYGKAWRALGLPKQPYVSATDLDAALGGLDRSTIHLAFAPPGFTVGRVLDSGGEFQFVIQDSMPVGSISVAVAGLDVGLGPILIAASNPGGVIYGDSQPPLVDEVYAQLGTRRLRPMPLSEYLRSPAALVLGTEISRQDVIKYIANKLGGVHFDSRRGGPDDPYVILDKDLARFTPTAKPTTTYVYTELLSAAEALRESADCARFRDAFRAKSFVDLTRF